MNKITGILALLSILLGGMLGYSYAYGQILQQIKNEQPPQAPPFPLKRPPLSPLAPLHFKPSSNKAAGNAFFPLIVFVNPSSMPSNKPLQRPSKSSTDQLLLSSACLASTKPPDTSKILFSNTSTHNPTSAVKFLTLEKEKHNARVTPI